MRFLKRLAILTAATGPLGVFLAGPGCVTVPSAVLDDPRGQNLNSTEQDFQNMNQGDLQNQPGDIIQMAGSVVVTMVQIQKDGMVAAGDGIIAFGSTVGGLTGVSFLRTGEPAATKIVGTFRGDAVYCTGTKVVLVADGNPKRVSVFDTDSEALAEIADSDVFDISPGANLENAYIAVDGGLVAYWNRGGPNGAELSVADIRGAMPVVKRYAEKLTGVSHLDVDGQRGEIAVMEDNQFITVFSATADAAAAPIRIDVKSIAGVPLAYSPKLRTAGGYALFADFNNVDAYLCNLDTQAISRLSVNPPAAADGAQQLAIRGGAFAYCLSRDVNDFDVTQGSRVATGRVADLSAISTGSGTAAGSARLGFGTSLAISPVGDAVYVAGRFGQSPGGAVNEPSILQANLGNGFEVLKDPGGKAVSAADVATGSNVVAFKVAVDELDIRLGYYLPR